MVPAMKEIRAEQLVKLPRQNARCAAAVSQIDPIDKRTGMSSDEYVGAAWSCRDKHYMMNLVVCIRQLETKTAKLPTGGEKLVTNVIACNNSLHEIQLSGWDQYAEQLAQILKVGEVEIIKPFHHLMLHYRSICLRTSMSKSAGM